MISDQDCFPGYRVNEILYEGYRTIVYRGYRATDLLPVVIKHLKSPYPSFSELLQFRNQYTIGKNLNYPGFIQTYSLEPFQNSYILVVEDYGGISLKDYFAGEKVRFPLSLERFLLIAISLCGILDCLYRQRIIHKDIKPSNILINPDTKKIKLIDLSIASLLPRETQTLISNNIIEGTLAYISPEQTGRMNRGIDYRTDLYSLGVTFYELLTGELPFKSEDPMELIYCHIAKAVPLVSEIRPQIPSIIAEIVKKLMAKNAEDRYQSALGLKYDLEKCLGQLQRTGEIASFLIAQRDLCDRFIIPDKLYGRESEVKTLLAAFERVSLGATEMMLVSGFSGIGKTAVVNEVHKPILRQRGYFTKGKFDQFNRNIPFSAFVQAFRDLMGQLLTESDAQILSWKNKILEAVGDNGQVIIEVIPELEMVIGKQPAVAELSGMAAENRFNLLFQKFTQVLTTKEHPLVIFLDDLQWADSASLKLIQLLMVDTRYLLLIGAYRDNEVTPAHPLILTLEQLSKTGAKLNNITLQPLSEMSLNQFVADTLHCHASLAQSLTKLVYRKTQGNPFFATQFLKALNQDGLIKFNFDLGCWECDIAQITQQAVTDDVVAFMALQLQKMPSSTQKILQLAACIGNQFDLATLAIATQQSEVETAAGLWKALQEEFILPISDVYKFYQGEDHQQLGLLNGNTNKKIANYQFLHDRVQQAAYSLIPDEQKIATHLQIGQLLLQNTSESEQEGKLFDIVGHLNLGQELISQPSQRQELAQLNLQAGVKARKSTAYPAARDYLQTGIDLLQTNCWENQYELTLNLYLTSAEVSYLNGDFERMEQQAAIVLQQARTVIDRVKIYEIQIAAKTLQSNVLGAIAVGRTALEQLGVELPQEAEQEEINKALQTLATQLTNIPVETLIDLPLTNDAITQAAMHILGILFSPIIQGMPGLLPLLSAKMVSLSLLSGNTVSSTIGYALHGLVMSAFLGDAATGYAFGKLALNLLARFNIPEIKPIVMFLFGNFIQPHKEPLRDSIQTLKIAYDVGIDTGDFMHAGFSLATHSNSRFFSGEELSSFAQDMASYSAILAQVKQYSAQAYINLGKQTAENLIESVEQPHCLIGNSYNETVMLPKHQQDNDGTAIAEAYIYKLLLAYCFGDYADAINYANQAQSYLIAVSGSFFVPIFYFYAALAHLTRLPSQSESEQAEILAIAQTYQTSLAQFAHHAPMNHQHKLDLIEAEKHRVLGNNYQAGDWYDRAITTAKTHEYLPEEALANELAAKFYRNWGKERVAAGYMQQAYYCYARWGAKGKTDQLENLYPHLLQPILHSTIQPLNLLETLAGLVPIASITHSSHANHSSSTSINTVLDLATILKVAQNLSGTIQIRDLLRQLTQIILTYSGGDRCAIILPQRNNTWQLEAFATPTATEFNPVPLNSNLPLPVKLINYVKNTLEVVVIDRLVTDLPVIDNYLTQQQPQSLLCLPLLNQGKAIAILYLENQLTSGVFSRDRLLILHFLCTQAAISLENARLFSDRQTAEAQLQEINAQLTHSIQLKDEFLATMSHELRTPLNAILGMTETLLDEVFGLVNEKQIEALQTIEQSGYHLLKLISDILDVSKIASGQIDLEFAKTAILPLCQQSLEFIKLEAEKKFIQVVSKLPTELPELYIDVLRIRQALIHLLNNAVKFTPPGGQITLEATIASIKQERDYLQIFVKDTGIGISPENVQKVFEPFTQIDSSLNRKYEGIGLGLALVKRIVELHSGDVTLTSALGVGSCFTISLPVLSAEC